MHDFAMRYGMMIRCDIIRLVRSDTVRNMRHDTFCCVKLRCVTVFDGVHPVLPRMSRSVTVITAREVYRYKMAYHGDKFLHIGAVTIVNNTDHTLHYAIE